MYKRKTWSLLAVILFSSFNLAYCSNCNNFECVNKKIAKQQNSDVNPENFTQQTDVTYSMNNFNLAVINSNLFNKLCNRSAVQHLDLSNNKINDIQQDTFEKFWGLEKLQLTGNYLGKIDVTDFKSLDFLVTLDLSSNLIETIEESAFGHLKKLLYLYLQDNCLKILSARLIKVKVMHMLDISQNLIDNFPKFEEVISIDNLNVSCNRLQEINFEKFNTSVIVLDASSNCISRIQSDKNSAQFADYARLTQRINLANNYLINVEQLWNFEGLEQIDLSDNVINFNESFHLLSSLKNLTHLHLTNTSLNSLGIFEHVITSNFKEVSIDKNPLYVDFDSLHMFSRIHSLKFQQSTCYKFKNYKDISEDYSKLKRLSIFFNASDCDCLTKHKKVFRLYNIKFNSDWNVCSNANLLGSSIMIYLLHFVVFFFQNILK